MWGAWLGGWCVRFDLLMGVFQRAMPVVLVDASATKTTTKTTDMKRTLSYLLPALCIGSISHQHLSAAAAASATPKVNLIAEGPMTLSETTGVASKPGSWLFSGTRIHVALHLAAWSKVVYGAERGIPYLHAYEYRHYPVLLRSLYIQAHRVNGSVKFELQPFPITNLETRDMTCLRRVGPQASWEGRKARFTLATRATVLEKVGIFSDGLGPWACTVGSSRKPMPSTCNAVEDDATDERRQVSVGTEGMTYFTFDRSGNYSYGVPGIVLGARDETRPAPLASDPSRGANPVNTPSQNTHSNAFQE